MKNLTLIFLILLLSYLTAEAAYLVDKTVDWQDAAGYVTLQAHKQVQTNPNASGSSYLNYYDWVQSIVYSSVSIKALNENTDFMATGRIRGTSDRKTVSMPPIPTYNRVFYRPGYTAYSGYQQIRVSWMKILFKRPARRDLYLSAGGSKYTYTYDPEENPFDPYAQSEGFGDPQEVRHGYIHTD